MIYLVYTAADASQIRAVERVDDVQELTEHLHVVDTPLSRSQLYHRLKPLQPTGAPLLVAELSEPPKAKGLAPGSSIWLRDRLP